MAKVFSAASKLYGIGSYGPFSVNGFTEADTKALRWTMSVEGWPTDRSLKLMTVLMKWDNGAYQLTDIYGGQTDMRGTPLTQVSGQLSLPMEADANGNPVSAAAAAGTISIQVYVPVQTAVTFAAVA